LPQAGPGNALSRALRMLGQIERTLFTLQWLLDPDLRQRSHAGLNKGEASNSLRRAVFFHRQGEIRDRTFENQSFRHGSFPLIGPDWLILTTQSDDRIRPFCRPSPPLAAMPALAPFPSLPSASLPARAGDERTFSG
jgi:hypothetical protein